MLALTATPLCIVVLPKALQQRVAAALGSLLARGCICSFATMRILLVTVLVCLALSGSASAGSNPHNITKPAPAKPEKPHVQPPKGCRGCPTAWAYISSTPGLSAVAGLLKAIGLDAALAGPFNGTLALPTNDAVAAYTAQFKADVTAHPEVFNSFLAKLLNYHFILRSAPAWQLDTIALSTRYMSWNAFPHRVTFVVDKSAVPKAAPKTWQWSAKSWANKPLPRLFPVSHIVDEQGKNVTFAKKDTFVQGGGVIHSINAVLGASDVFPSLTAAGAAYPQTMSSLMAMVDQVSAALNISVIDQIENTPGTLATPSNLAIIATLTQFPIIPTPQMLYALLAYHLCPAPGGSVKGLLYTRFTTNPKFNPCLTLLGIDKKEPSLKLQYKSTANADVLKPDTNTITFLDLNNEAAQAGILVPDITTPLAVTHVIDTVLLPPVSNLA
ncbi:hypothetical protein OEZ85_004352 [Tetradesmus obliquus]|uniref:FAS1 domain-containing protein n=1 Tax=Tetradesmus obliquus TaxID=3088 RepID=A0ABY8UMX9_TETOB|nr:hypothetical protein OEZ85_004352 [Tetradesmus obliquus]